MKLASTFARNITAILAHTGESRASLCKRTGISKTALHDFLAGHSEPSFKTTLALVQAFGFNSRWLLTGVKARHLVNACSDKAIVPAPPKVDPDAQAIAKLKQFSIEHNLNLDYRGNCVEFQLGDAVDSGNWYMWLCGCGKNEKARLLDLAKQASEQNFRKIGSSLIFRAPNFFA